MEEGREEEEEEAFNRAQCCGDLCEVSSSFTSLLPPRPPQPPPLPPRQPPPRPSPGTCIPF
ncbi:hypothetical protein E2C01_053636 [Portunus trituberculatus]|uniref:Uncharacterized protein n=1 Tax=Portunus trituberculatus TaxID=210409 RepID=A0A5B7GKV6_PORTR|nr:hypothetical protein [Portunus trituberculatus]